ncbi:DMT family transporter [Leptolyngbya sp. NK1-12]|uniref:DMT family transporter n=1 Tax=Leptolyngbya sp. NK1-12 TaxID=2547451 RepID=A0AA96WKS8_9CYAN|nr:DMT family transporter [Leptolyngbya sp. NK1-12]WNZ27413.1 DMT family transporter [Leptolyngbya sp. NK1-12]
MLGFLIVLLSSVFFCFQNVIVRVLFNQQTVLGVFETGGFVTPNLHHSFLLMFMRMLLGVPLMASIAPRLYGPMWRDVARLAQPEQRFLLLQSVGCGGLMFLYLALLYISIGLIPTSIALTLFFTYPVFTALFSWKWFGNRPTGFRWSIMAAVLLGSLLTMPVPNTTAGDYNWTGVITGVVSGVAYALYTVVAQKSFEKLHPVPFSWISFTTTLVLSGLCLLLWPGGQDQLPWLPLWIGGLLSALMTFSGHILNNLGIRRIGATTAAMIGASNPALTAVLAWLAIQETLTSIQLVGVGVVTLSVGLLSLKRSQ